MSKKQKPETSLAAYRSLDPVQMAEIYQKILWGLGQIKEGSYEDVALAIRLPKERVWKRLSELMKAGLIYRPGNTKILSSGRKGFTWRLVAKDGPNEKVTEKSLPGKTISDYSKSIKQLSLL
jgi:predicted transcriptional regulator